jgi:hypothetical protein
MFGVSLFEIPYGYNSIRSGPPRLRAGARRSLTWSYSVVLTDNGVEVEASRLDPDIIVKDDP